MLSSGSGLLLFAGCAITSPGAAKTIEAFLNAKCQADVAQWVQKLTPLGEEMKKKNYFSRGTWTLHKATVRQVTQDSVHVDVQVKLRSQKIIDMQTDIVFSQPCAKVDVLQREMIRWNRQVGREYASAAFLDLPGAENQYTLPQNMWLNTIPSPRDIRSMFYEDFSTALRAAIKDPRCPNRMSAIITPPELNMDMDTYRVGTLLELARKVALDLYAEGKKIRICVQGSMGQGVFTSLPRPLSGVRKLLTIMDWQARVGEKNEGALGTMQDLPKDNVQDAPPRIEGPIRFGAIGADHVADDDDVLLLLAPQNMVGVSLYEPLSEMAAAAGDRPMILLNPILCDRPSSGGLMSVRGRADRMSFYDSFHPIYMFRLLYSEGMFPIRGALRMSWSSSLEGLHPLYVMYARTESEGKSLEDKSEYYEAVGVFEHLPGPDVTHRLLSTK